MASVADYADEFVRRAHARENPSAFVPKKHLVSFLEMLKREGMEFSRDCLAEISDPEMKQIVETIFFATVAGAVVGAGIGVVVAGTPGAQVGVVVGTAVGFATGCIAVTIVAEQKGNGLQISVARDTGQRHRGQTTVLRASTGAVGVSALSQQSVQPSGAVDNAHDLNPIG